MADGAAEQRVEEAGRLLVDGPRCAVRHCCLPWRSASEAYCTSSCSRAFSAASLLLLGGLGLGELGGFQCLCLGELVGLGGLGLGDLGVCKSLGLGSLRVGESLGLGELGGFRCLLGVGNLLVGVGLRLGGQLFRLRLGLGLFLGAALASASALAFCLAVSFLVLAPDLAGASSSAALAGEKR